MSRYVDVDAVCELFEPFTDAFTDVEVTSAYVQTLTLLANAPSIDIVRCKECKWSEPTNDGWNSVTCEFYGETTLTMPTDGFCSYGERREP